MFIILLAAQALVNLIGAFGPEIGFDALWYHLTIPKLYLMAGKIYHIPGGLLYYSEMPRLTEILYLPLLKYFADVGPHLLNLGAGIGVIIIIYKLSRQLGLSSFFAYLAALMFYVTPLVGWQSGSGYVDLFRTFFEILALYFIFSQKPSLAGLAIGLAISTKTLALGSLIPLVLLARQRGRFLVSCFLVIFPWFLASYLNTGYPFYPIGAGILDSTHIPTFNPADFYKLWLVPKDPISPIYIIIIPFLWPVTKNKKFIGLLLYCFIGALIWFLIPRTGGGRFILPYLPAFAIIVSGAIEGQKSKFIKNILIITVVLITLINIIYRLAAEIKLIPYFLGRQTKTQYLCQHLDLKVNYVNCHHNQPSGLVLVKDYHNLYYVDFPFVHETWYRGEKYSDIISP